MGTDRWGEPVAVDSQDAVDAWNQAWAEASHFIGDPFVTLEASNSNDLSFALGSVFCGAYRILGGAPPDTPAVAEDLRRAIERSVSEREQGHTEALTLLIAGDFTSAAQRWDDLATNSNDYAAVRFAHDVYLHVGDAARRLRSSQRAFDRWERGQPGWNFIAGQLSFALEEVGLYDEAEALGHEALTADPMDLWALHSLAHLYETLDDSEAALGLLEGRQDVWTKQDGLAVHIWWHLALRLIATGAVDEALAIHDRQLSIATTPFRLCDLASLLWRLELVGVDVGDRWDELANRFSECPERHTSGFLDLHAAFVYARRPDHPAATTFHEGIACAHPDASSENAQIFAAVVRPLVEAIRIGHNQPQASIELLDSVAGKLHRIGGSIAQRDVVALTRNHYDHRLSTSFSSRNAPEAT